MPIAATLSSARQDWATPQTFFDRLHAAFDFTLDAAAEPHTAKCDRYFTPEDDALTQQWSGRVWLNPPYNKHQVKFVERAARMAGSGVAELVAVLIPARPDTKLWQRLILPEAAAVVWVRGRIKFGIDASDFRPAPFPSALVVFTRRELSAAERSALQAVGYTQSNAVQAVREQAPLFNQAA